MPTRQSLATCRIARVGVTRANASVLSNDYQGLITVTLTFGTGEVEQSGGDPLGVDMLSDEFQVASGELTLLDSPENFTAMDCEDTGGMLTGQHRTLWLAPTSDATGQTPSNLEFMFEAAFLSSSIEVVTPQGGTWTVPFSVHGKVTELTIA